MIFSDDHSFGYLTFFLFKIILSSAFCTVDLASPFEMFSFSFAWVIIFHLFQANILIVVMSLIYLFIYSFFSLSLIKKGEEEEGMKG